MPEPTPTGGRPRDAGRDDAILTAATELLGSGGDRACTIDRIATRAGVSKATIYRRWSSRDEVVVAAVERLSSAVPAPDTGDLRQDLLAIAGALRALFVQPTTARFVASLVGQMSTSPALAAALRRGFLADRRAAARAALEREAARGGLRPEVDLDVAVDLLAAPFYYRLLLTGEPLDEAFVEEVVSAVVTFASR